MYYDEIQGEKIEMKADSPSIVHTNTINSGVYRSANFYYFQALKELEFSFCPLLILDKRMRLILQNSLRRMHADIKRFLLNNTLLRGQIQEKLGLKTYAFIYAQGMPFDVLVLPEDDERRLCLQALLLFILRPYFPLKYSLMSDFLQVYPSFKLYESKNMDKLERLRVTANWIELALHVTPNENCEYLLMDLVTRICRGRLKRYDLNAKEFSQGTIDRLFIIKSEVAYKESHPEMNYLLKGKQQNGSPNIVEVDVDVEEDEQEDERMNPMPLFRLSNGGDSTNTRTSRLGLGLGLGSSLGVMKQSNTNYENYHKFIQNSESRVSESSGSPFLKFRITGPSSCNINSNNFYSNASSEVVSDDGNINSNNGSHYYSSTSSTARSGSNDSGSNSSDSCLMDVQSDIMSDTAATTTTTTATTITTTTTNKQVPCSSNSSNLGNAFEGLYGHDHDLQMKELMKLSNNVYNCGSNRATTATDNCFDPL